MPLANELTYRLLREISDLQQVMDLQELVWGDAPDAIIPLPLLRAMTANGAPAIGAFDDDLLVGISIGYLGMDLQGSSRPAMANLKLASNRLAVHPDYRSTGIGYRLKMEQKAFANKQGIRLITWTFDPLISRNAYLYIHKLGGVARYFLPGFYRDMPGKTDSVGYADRLFCEWWVTSNRVEEKLHGDRKDLGLEEYLEGSVSIINPTSIDKDGRLLPYEGSAELGVSALLLVEIPSDYETIEHDELLARSWREHIRAVFEQVFGFGYIITDCLYEEYEGRLRSFYLFGFNGGDNYRS